MNSKESDRLIPYSKHLRRRSLESLSKSLLFFSMKVEFPQETQLPQNDIPPSFSYNISALKVEIQLHGGFKNIN